MLTYASLSSPSYVSFFPWMMILKTIGSEGRAATDGTIGLDLRPPLDALSVKSVHFRAGQDCDVLVHHVGLEAD